MSDATVSVEVIRARPTGLTVADIWDWAHETFDLEIDPLTPAFGLTSLNLGGRVTQLTCRDEATA